ncbi:zinc transporter ZIP10-like [Lineus longissimus]|uniref:zinc transporter ZIP10-like n=1 Tax=Lineus longissimus TaxID=88925 RepID=UPI002B4CCC7B
MGTKIEMCGKVSRQYCIICLMLLAFHAKVRLCETNATTVGSPSNAGVENRTAVFTGQATGSTAGGDEVTTAAETISDQVSHNAGYQSTEPNVRKSDQEPQEKQEMFLKLIFDKYGKDGTISYEGFEHLMVSLGLGNIKIAHALDDHWNKDQGQFKEFHEDHKHPLDSGEGDSHDHDHDHDHASHDHNNHVHSSTETDDYDDYDDYGFLSDIFYEDLPTATPGVTNAKSKPERSAFDQLKPDGVTTSSTKQEVTTQGMKTTSADTATRGSQDSEYSKCMSPPNLLNAFHQSETKGVTQESFLKLCPAIIYQIDLHTCSRNGCNKGRPSTGAHVRSHGDHDHDHDHDHVHKSPLNSTTKEWDFFSIPLEVWGYSTLSVLVISLVGLCGVAIVPVIQKVFYTHLIQYLVALAVGSLAGDAMLHLLPHAISKHSHDAPVDDHGHDHAAEEGGHLDGVWKGLMGLAGIYIFFIMERLMVIINEHRRRRPKKKKGRFRKLEDGSNKIGNKLCNHQVLYKSCEDIVLVMHHDKAIKDLAHEASGRPCKQSGSEDGCCEESERLSEVTNETGADDQSDATPRAHGHSHGGHGHSHGKVPTTVASVAWMVILGDGLHNFSDGLAIGAAFANSLTGGLSTSIAVFCHELPHELGDFAVLLHAGMSVKQALVYNGVSSILCFFGMLIGVSIGNMAGASLWIFSLTAGMFLYIALVDMLPEMANVDSKSHSILHFVLQNFGMVTGIAIMLLIAIYEDKILIEL